MRIEPPLLLPPLSPLVPQSTGRNTVLPEVESGALEEVVRTGEVLPAGDLQDQSWRLVASATPTAPANAPRALAVYSAVSAETPARPVLDLYV